MIKEYNIKGQLIGYIKNDSCDRDTYTVWGTTKDGRAFEAIWIYDDWFNNLPAHLKENGDAWEMLVEKNPDILEIEGKKSDANITFEIDL